MPQAILRNRERELASLRGRGSDLPSGLRRLVGDPDPGIDDRRRGPDLPSGLRRILGDPDPSGGKPTGKPPVYNNPDPETFKAGPDPDPYPTVLPSLSAAQLGELSQRRSVADQRLKQAEADRGRGTTLLEASAIRARQSAERDSRRSIEDFMRQSAGRGLARSPMVAGRQQRREGEDLRLAHGEIDTRLSTEIATLQDMVSKATDARNQEIAFIKQDKVNMRTDLERLFPASGMYG